MSDPIIPQENRDSIRKEKKRLRDKLYRQTPAGRENQRRRYKKYRDTPKGKATKQRGYNSDGYKAWLKEYVKGESRKKNLKNYNQSQVGKENARRFKAKRRARLAQNGGEFTTQEWLELCKKFDNCCACCGERKKLEADHVVPISKGGTSDITNIQPLCRNCNASKGDKTVDYRNGIIGIRWSQLRFDFLDNE